jgi:hypothetical protein
VVKDLITKIQEGWQETRYLSKIYSFTNDNLKFLKNEDRIRL